MTAEELEKEADAIVAKVKELHKEFQEKMQVELEAFAPIIDAATDVSETLKAAIVRKMLRELDRL